MPERTLDQVIEHYRAAGQQVSMPTPMAPPMVTPFMPQRPPYIVPNAFQRTHAPGVARTIEHYMGSGVTQGMNQMAPPVTPQPPMAPPIPMGGMTPAPMFHDPFQAMAQRQVGGLATTASGINQQWVSQAGQRWGGRIGAGLGAAGGFAMGGGWGAVHGAGLGEVFGGWAGNVANDIPFVGSAMRGYNRLRWGGAMEQMAGANQLRQGTMGNMNLQGAGADMLTGTGMSAQGALDLSQQFGRMKVPGMNRNDLTNLAGAASETGFLQDATNVDQVAKTVKGLANLMGKLAQLTGDPDFRNNLQQLANLRNAGLNVSQSVAMLEQMPMFGRAAGGAQRAQAGANIGAGMFQGAGLTPGLGMQVGAATAGIVHQGMGGVSDIQRGLWGGQEGITKKMVGMQAEFMGRTASMLLPYLAKRGPDGELTIDEERMKAFRSGKVGFQEMIQQGAANIGGLGFGSVQDMLQQAPELQTELGQKMGPMGGFVGMANMARNLQRSTPGMTLGNAAEQVAGRGRGRILERFMTDPNVAKGMIKQITVQQRQVRLKGRQAALAAQVAEKGWFDQWRDEKRDEMKAAAAADPDARRALMSMGLLEDVGEQELEAFERTREQEIEESEQTGLRRIVHRPGARVSEKEEKLAEGRLGESTKRLLSKAQDPTTGAKAGELTEAQEGAVAKWRGKEVFWGTRLFQGDDVKAYRKKALGHIREVGGRIRETRKISEEQYDVGESRMRKSMEEQFGDNYHKIMAAIKTKVVAYARTVGSGEGRGLKMPVIRNIIKKALTQEGGLSPRNADKWMAKNGASMERWAIRWIDKSGDKNATKALQRTEGALGLAENAFSAEAVEENEEALGEDLNETYAAVGLAASEDAPSKEEEAGISALFEEEDAEVRAAATLMGQTKVGSPEEQQAMEEQMSRLRGTMGEKKWKRAQALSKKLTSGQRERMRGQWGGKIARGEMDFKEYSQQLESGITGKKGAGDFMKLGFRTGLAELQRRRHKAGTEDDATEVGEGAGLGTKATDKQIAGLEEQKKMLQNMANNMNKAASALLKTSHVMAEVTLQAGVPKP